MEEEAALEAFREVNLSDGKCNVSLYVCAEEERKIDADPDYACELFKAALEGKLPTAGDESDTGVAGEDAPDEVKEKEPNKIVELEWDSQATWFFLKIIKKNCHLLPMNTGNRKRLFKRVQEDLLEEGYDVPFESIRHKFNSLITTYNRIQFKAKRIGKVKTRWEFYELFDEIMKQADTYSSKDTKNGTSDVLQDTAFVDIAVKEEPLLMNDEELLCEDAANGSAQSATLNNSDSSSREPSSERIQKSPVKQETSPKAKLKEPSVPLHKRRRLLDNDKLANTNVKKSPQGKKKDVTADTEIVEPVGTERLIEGPDHIIVSGEGFNHAATLLFIDCLKRNKDLLKAKKSAEMFTRIKRDMASEGFSFTEAKLRKKWYNLLISYRRILERANETGDLVASWPYYEALDNIITDTKALAQTKIVNGSLESSEPANSMTSPSEALRASEHSRLRGAEEYNSPFISRGRRGKAGPVLDLIDRSNDYPSSADVDDSDYRRRFLEDWQKREERREERDKMKLSLLQKIAKSIEALTRKQDAMINILKTLQ